MPLNDYDELFIQDRVKTDSRPETGDRYVLTGLYGDNDLDDLQYSNNPKDLLETVEDAGYMVEKTSAGWDVEEPVEYEVFGESVDLSLEGGRLRQTSTLVSLGRTDAISREQAIKRIVMSYRAEKLLRLLGEAVDTTLKFKAEKTSEQETVKARYNSDEDEIELGKTWS